MAFREMAWWLCLPAAALAQAAPPGPAPGLPPNRGDRVAIAVWSVEQSLGLFRACDRNGDDRLDVFEAMAAIEPVRDRTVFRRLDRDRDGYLDWPEFDRFYRELVRGGDALRLRLLHPPPQAPADAEATGEPPARQRLIELFDADHSGVLEAAEIEAMLRAFELPPQFAAMLRGLDRDHDGKFTASELGPVMAQFQLGGAFAQKLKPVASKSSLPPPWRAIDSNGDDAIDADELAAALRRVDPELARWTKAIVAAADRNGNGRLTADELATMPEPEVKAVVERGARR